jgi:hypothetical protein
MPGPLRSLLGAGEIFGIQVYSPAARCSTATAEGHTISRRAMPFARRRHSAAPLCRTTRLSRGEGLNPEESAAKGVLPGFRLHAARQTTRLSRGRGLDSTETAAKGVLPAPPPQSTRCRTRGNVCAHCVVAPSCALRTCYPSDVARSRARVNHRLNCHRRASYVPCANYANPPFAACHPFYSMEKTAHFDPFGRVMKGSCPPILGSTTNAQNKWRGAFGTEG